MLYRVFLSVALLLLVCVSGICSNKNACRIDSDVEYLNAIPLIVLRSEDGNVLLPSPYVDYNILDVDDIVFNRDNKVGKKLNICPPVALVDVINEE